MNLPPPRTLPENLQDFQWAVGVECSILPHIKVDQFQWTQHDTQWKNDFKLIADDFGKIGVRYCLPWSMLEPQRGKFDWGWADERIDYIAGELGLKLMLDIVHFGTPLWLSQAVGDPEFPERLEHLTQQIVSRYRDSIKAFCPFNEPVVTALFSGDFGFWPPHSRRWRGYMPVLNRIVQGTARSIRAIREIAPEATVILCDVCEHHHTREEHLKPEVALRNLRRFAVLDLLTGRVDSNHPLYNWFVSYGISEPDLAWMRTNRWAPDVIGLDYYAHTETQLESTPAGQRQRKPENPLGMYGCAQEYWNRYGIPLMLTETSIEGSQINREIWLEKTIGDCKRLRQEGVPILGFTWWPFFDNVDWDGALLHHIGKIHSVGLYNLRRQPGGLLKRVRSPLAKMFAEAVRENNIGELTSFSQPAIEIEEEAIDAIPSFIEQITKTPGTAKAPVRSDAKCAGNSTAVQDLRLDRMKEVATHGKITRIEANGSADDYGIIVFCHLRWGFVWQRPQQLVSRYARKHPVLFIEEPMFDLTEGESRLFMHRVMSNVVVACPHFRIDEADDKAKVLAGVKRFALHAVAILNDSGKFTSPLLYYYNPIDVSWSLGQFNERGVVYDCMDELSQFKNAPKELIHSEKRLLEIADTVFTGGHRMYLNKSRHNKNCHFFGCGVDVAHFAQAQAADTSVPPDIDFVTRPILGWFGVIDERVDYPLLDKIAERHPEWSIAMVGPVVKVDPNLLPNRPNLFWLGGRDYQVLPNYCKAFTICMMPFAINKSTEYINPTKALEYMATGKPVVSTAIADVIRNFGGVVKIAGNHDEFIAACEEAIQRPDPAILKEGFEMAERNTWDANVNRMMAIMDEALARKPGKESARASATQIETDEGLFEITWSYPSVAGS